MAMLGNYQWQPAPPGLSKRYYDVSSPHSPITIRNRTISRNAVPSGIVASRVLLLQQTCQNKSDASSGCSFASTRKQESRNSRTDFGTWLTDRFGQPAIQNPISSGDVQLNAYYTSAGPNTARTNRKVDYDTDPRLRTTQSSTQMHLLAQSIALRNPASGKTLMKSKSQNYMCQQRNSIDLDVLEELDPIERSHFTIQTPISPPGRYTGGYDSYRNGPETQERRLDSLDSEFSATTTSTIRRQSVKELFKDYGVDRPAGLVSKQTSREADNSTWMEEPRRECHLCGWINNDSFTLCRRCGHNACSKCDNRRVESLCRLLGVNKPLPKRVLEMSNPRLPTQEQKIVEDPIKHFPFSVSTMSPGWEYTELNRNESSSSSKFPDLTAKVSGNTIALSRSTTEQPRQVSLLTGTQTTTKVKESPFLLADSHVPRQPIRLFPVRSSESYSNRPMTNAQEQILSEEHRKYAFPNPQPGTLQPQVGRTIFHAEHYTAPLSISNSMYRGQKELNDRSAPDSNSDEVFEEDNLPAMPDVRSRSELDDNTDSDFSMTTTILKGLSKALYQPRNISLNRLSISSSVPSNPFSFSRIWIHANAFDKDQVPEFVECHGFPRTAYARRSGSPITGSAVGECQHCLDDCDCEACQRADHNVRCCTHPRHRAISHRHYTPQRKETALQAFESSSFSLRGSLNTSPVSPSSPAADAPLTPNSLDVLWNKEIQLIERPTLPLSTRYHQTKDSKSATSSKVSRGPIETSSVNRRGSPLNVGKSKLVIPTVSMNEVEPESPCYGHGFSPTERFPMFIPYDMISQPTPMQQPKLALKTAEGEDNPTMKAPVISHIDNVKVTRENSTFPSTQKANGSRDLKKRSETKTESDTPPKIWNVPELKSKTSQDQKVLADQGAWNHATENSHPPSEHSSHQESNRPGSRQTSTSGSDKLVSERKPKLKLIEKKLMVINGDNPSFDLSQDAGLDSSFSSGSTFTFNHESRYKGEHQRYPSRINGPLSGRGSTTGSSESDDNHHCKWKRIYRDVVRNMNVKRNGRRGGRVDGERVKSAEINIRGITVVLHLEGREDLIIKAESWVGGE